ncbi:MAG: hypothetical protein ACI845_002130 [Gammaproteobacteria bacterium]|jgi:hypothetical protein
MKAMKAIKASAIYIMLLFLYSCGQGEDGSSSSSGGESSSTSLEDLNVSSDFDFIGGETLTVTIVDESSSIERRYLNICSDFTDDNGAFSVSYESCLLRTSLQSQYSEFEIVISSTQQELIAQIWPLQDGALPVNQRWSRSEDGADWQITLF